MESVTEPTQEFMDPVSARASAWSALIAMAARPALEAERQSQSALGFALKVVDNGLRAVGSGGVRCVPSAGAIFPYDVLILCCRNAEQPSRLYRLDLDRRTCMRLPVDSERVDALLRGPAPDNCDVRLILTARPWLSMRKYGTRGYLFTQLDCGHAATNLLGAALDTATARLRLNLPRTALAHELAKILPYRDVHSVLDLWSQPKAGDSVGWEIAWLPGEWPPDSTARLEQFCWSGLPQALLGGDGSNVTATMGQHLVTADWLDRDYAIHPGEWTGLSRLRRSCRKFTKRSIEASALEQTLGALTTSLPMDLDPIQPTDFSLTLVTRPQTAPGFESGGSQDEGVRVVRTDWVDQPTRIADAFFGQQHLGLADVFAVFHASQKRLFEIPGSQRLREALFRASAAAQLIYMGAARSGAAITASGGFNSETWKTVARINPQDEVLYILALGSETTDEYKLDRSEIAHAQGER
jgi:Nitroreductase family